MQQAALIPRWQHSASGHTCLLDFYVLFGGLHMTALADMHTTQKCCRSHQFIFYQLIFFLPTYGNGN